MSNNKHGGPRSKPGAKRKPKMELVKGITSYHRLCDIILIGGFDAAREIAKAAIEKEIKAS